MSFFCPQCGIATVNGNYVCGHTPAPNDAKLLQSFEVEKMHCDECDCDFDVKAEAIAEHADHLNRMRMLCTIPGKQPFWMAWDFFREGGLPEGMKN